MTIGLAVVPVVRVLNVTPASVEYWYVVIALPPVLPAVKATDSCWLLGVIASIVGAAGVVRGVSVVVAEKVPVPAVLTAATRKVYSTPLVSPVTVAPVVAVTASLKVCQREPPLSRNWTT